MNQKPLKIKDNLVHAGQNSQIAPIYLETKESITIAAGADTER